MVKRQNQVIFLKEKIASLDDQLKRAVADYRNLEKRVTEGRLEFGNWATFELVKKLLPVLDSLDKSVEGASHSEAESAWLKGVMMSIRELRQVLSEEGLIEISTESKFDPLLHEAIDVREGENDKILEVVQRGYMLQGKVLRPARVVVGRQEVISG